jgi:hypothetical protein
MKELELKELLKQPGFLSSNELFKVVSICSNDGHVFLAIDNVWGTRNEGPRQPTWYYLWIYSIEPTYNYECGQWGWPKGSARLVGNCAEDTLLTWVSLSPEDLTYLKFSGKTDHLLFKVIVNRGQ